MMYAVKKAAAGLVLAAAIALAGCQGETTAAEASTSEVPSAQTAAYLCPMGCEGSASNEPGKCPVCGMDLEHNPAAKTGAATPDSL